MNYVLGIDQSTQGTKAVIFDETGAMIGREDFSHKQIINEQGWVSHNLEEIYANVLKAVEAVIVKNGIPREQIKTVGISNQRETTAAWDASGHSLGDAIVWQCKRAEEIAQEKKDYAKMIYETTGLPLSPFFPAAKMAWLLRNQITTDDYYLGTMDSWLVYKLTKGKEYKTDYSNASRTQLFNLHTLCWDETLCNIFGVPVNHLPQVCDSNACFGYTDFDGLLPGEIPIHGVLGDSHGALFGQGCHRKGMIKTTYGTGSSMMMNIGEEFVQSKSGLATSLAWGMDGKVAYVLEGNINYTGAVVTWLQKDVGLIASPKELEELIHQANKEDSTVLIPAFSGLSAPYWKGEAKAMLYGMTRTTGKNEIVKASVESIAYQINDVLNAMKADSGITIEELRVDGGPTGNHYLMQFQSDLGDVKVCVPSSEELSVIGAAYMAGIGAGIYDRASIFSNMKYETYTPSMKAKVREKLEMKWKEAMDIVVSHS